MKTYSWRYCFWLFFVLGIIVYVVNSFLVPFPSPLGTLGWFPRRVENLLFLPYAVLVAWFFFANQHRFAEKDYLTIICGMLTVPLILCWGKESGFLTGFSLALLAVLYIGPVILVFRALSHLRIFLRRHRTVRG
ncbi:MAG: hypothetical protein WCX27_01155 [Candidatus Paceibacterota bacterium]|jgi:hypothetical protein